MNNGGPAFPLIAVDKDIIAATHSGMSLRDYLAAHALPCLIAADTHHDVSTEEHARDAYILADAMLKERLKQ